MGALAHAFTTHKSGKNSGHFAGFIPKEFIMGVGEWATSCESE